MTQPSPQDDLPAGSWTFQEEEHNEQACWAVYANSICIADWIDTESLARAIAAIPEREEFARKRAMDIVTLGVECGRLTAANESLRAENASLRQESVQYAQEADRLREELEQWRRLKPENERLRAEELKLKDLVRGLEGGQDKLQAWAKLHRQQLELLRAEKAELIEMLATRTTHPEYVEVLRRYKHENETEA